MNILVTGAWRCTQTQLNQIAMLGHRVFFLQQEREKLPLPYEQVEAVICNGLFLHHPIENFTKLRYIQLTSAGFDRVPMEYIKAHNIESTMHGAFTASQWPNLLWQVYYSCTSRVAFFR